MTNECCFYCDDADCELRVYDRYDDTIAFICERCFTNFEGPSVDLDGHVIGPYWDDVEKRKDA